MLPTPAELREYSRRYREAAANATDTATKRLLAAHAAALAQIAEAIEREGEVVQAAKKERYKGLLAEPLGESVRRMVQDLLSKAKAAPDARPQIKALRMRAEELRTTAEQFEVPSAREALRRAAANYDKLADQAEALLTKRPPAPTGKTG